MSSARPNRTEPVIALAATIVGVGLTTWAAFNHAATLVVPGATLVLVGGAWLGNTLARLDVRLLPTPSADQRLVESAAATPAAPAQADR